MDHDNVLSQGIEGLFTMKENLLELEGYKNQSTELSVKEDQLEKQIDLKEKAVTDEIAATIKKRRLELEASYDEQIDKSKARVKKVKSKMVKEKDVQVSERIKTETSDLTAEKVRLKEEIKSVYQKNGIPRIFNNSIYHALFLPRSFKDILTIIAALLICLLIIPVGVYHLFLPQKTAVLVGVYFVTVIVFGGLYLLINTKTKEGKAEAIIDIRALRAKQAKNQKKINAMAKDIRKDKDESPYELGTFRDELNDLETEIKSVSEEKKNALVDFETNTKDVITEEIRSRYQEEIKNLKKEHEQVYSDQKKAEEKAKMFSIEIANKYESYVGKDMLSVLKIDGLIALLQEGKASTVSEALAIYQQRTSEQ